MIRRAAVPAAMEMKWCVGRTLHLSQRESPWPKFFVGCVLRTISRLIIKIINGSPVPKISVWCALRTTDRLIITKNQRDSIAEINHR
jgi:hypothetical protein